MKKLIGILSGLLMTFVFVTSVSASTSIWQIGTFDNSRGELKGSGLDGIDSLDFYVGTDTAADFPGTLYFSYPFSPFDYRGVHQVTLHFSLSEPYINTTLKYGRAGDETDEISADGDLVDTITGTENSWAGSPYFIDLGTLFPGDHTITIETTVGGTGDDAHVVDALELTGDQVHGYVHGGGQIIEEQDSKPKDWYKISFGGWIWDLGGVYTGDWEINFHNVDQGFGYKKFHATDILDVNFYDPKFGETTCNDAMNFVARGYLDNQDEAWLVFRAGDYMSPGQWAKEESYGYAFDTVRISIFDNEPTINSRDGDLYETKDDFDSTSSCVGTSRTKLDNGNITIWHE